MQTYHYTAAGGLVLRGADLLILYKQHKKEYVLPKGHVEPGETLEGAALRETREETGYINFKILTQFGVRQAEFPLNGRWVTRDETYFLMALVDETRDEDQQYDDAERDKRIFQREWVPLSAAADKLTYEPAKSFAREAVAWLAANPAAHPTSSATP